MGPPPAAVPLPGRLAPRPAVGVVGREAELDAMATTYKRVAGGEGREVLLVSGEAGSGKTTLVAEAARAASAEGAWVALGHCDEEVSRPYQLLSEALSHLVIHAPDSLLAAHLAEHGSELSRLVPALSRRLPELSPSRGTDADTERYLFFAATVGLLALVSQGVPWSSCSTTSSGRTQRASSCCGTWPAPTLRCASSSSACTETQISPLSTRWWRHSRPCAGRAGSAGIALPGLDDAGVLTYMEAVVGHRLDQDGIGLAHAVYRETDGNPFFVGEVLCQLSENGVLLKSAAGQRAVGTKLSALALPDSVRKVLGARVARLGEMARRALAWAAVIGGEFDLDLVAGVSGIDEGQLVDVLDAAMAAALVRELAPGRYSFRHALIQRTLYEDTDRTWRGRAHRRVAEAMEAMSPAESGARVRELAFHWLNATQPAEVSKALYYSWRAAEEAAAALAPDEALRYYNQALELEDQVPAVDQAVHLDVLIGKGTAERQVGDPAYRETLLTAARKAFDVGDADRLVQAALANSRGWFSALGIVDTERLALLERAIESHPHDHPDRALLLATLCNELTGNTLERRRLAEEAAAIAHRLGDETLMARVTLGIPLECLPVTDGDFRRAEAIGDPALLFWANSAPRVGRCPLWRR